jgi:hypothetical protein
VSAISYDGGLAVVDLEGVEVAVDGVSVFGQVDESQISVWPSTGKKVAVSPKRMATVRHRVSRFRRRRAAR